MDDEKRIQGYINNLPLDCLDFLTSPDLSISTRLAYARELKIYMDYLAAVLKKEVSELTLMDIKDIDVPFLECFFNEYIISGLSGSALRRKRAVLFSYYKFLVKNKKAPYNPITGLRDDFLPEREKSSKPQVDLNILIAIPDHVLAGTGLSKMEMLYHDKLCVRNASILSLLIDCGIQTSDLVKLRIIDVDFDESYVYIAKNERYLPLSERTVELLQQYVTDRNSFYPFLSIYDPLFISLEGNALCVRQIQKLVRRYTGTTIGEIRSAFIQNATKKLSDEELQYVIGVSRKYYAKSLMDDK